jgi:hypothetical protein
MWTRVLRAAEQCTRTDAVRQAPVEALARQPHSRLCSKQRSSLERRRQLFGVGVHHRHPYQNWLQFRSSIVLHDLEKLNSDVAVALENWV